jgi:hypothetical protein
VGVGEGSGVGRGESLPTHMHVHTLKKPTRLFLFLLKIPGHAKDKPRFTKVQTGCLIFGCVALVIMAGVLVGLGVSGKLGRSDVDSSPSTHNLIDPVGCGGTHTAPIKQQRRLKGSAGLSVVATRPNATVSADDVHLLMPTFFDGSTTPLVPYLDVEERNFTLENSIGSARAVLGSTYQGFGAVTAIENVVCLAGVKDQDTPTFTLITFVGAGGDNTPLMTRESIVSGAGITSNVPSSWYVRDMQLMSTLQLLILASSSEDQDYSLYSIGRDDSSGIWGQPVKLVSAAGTNRDWVSIVKLGRNPQNVGLKQVSTVGAGDVPGIHIFDARTGRNLQILDPPAMAGRSWGLGYSSSESGKWLLIPNIAAGALVLYRWNELRYTNDTLIVNQFAPNPVPFGFGCWTLVTDDGRILVAVSSTAEVLSTNVIAANTGWVEPPLKLVGGDGTDLTDASAVTSLGPGTAWSASDGTWRALMTVLTEQPSSSSNVALAYEITSECVRN